MVNDAHWFDRASAHIPGFVADPLWPDLVRSWPQRTGASATTDRPGAGFVTVEHFREQGRSSWEIGCASRALPAPAGAPQPIDLVLDRLAIMFTEGNAAATATCNEPRRYSPAFQSSRSYLGRGGQIVSTAISDSEGFHAMSA
jgi:hypothetical protein